MAKKKPGPRDGIVFSTDPAFAPQEEEVVPADTLPPKQQPLKIRLDTRQRAGRAVTLVSGFAGKDEDLEELGRRLKTFCGTGGSVKDREIIIQGDQREKALQWLLGHGYVQVKKLN
jgi:translation initiation factor 1